MGAEVMAAVVERTRHVWRPEARRNSRIQIEKRKTP